MLNKKVRILTAQTQLSAKILIGLPIFLFSFLTITSPDYLRPFYDTTEGRYMLVGMIVSVTLGYLIMKKLAVLRY